MRPSSTFARLPATVALALERNRVFAAVSARFGGAAPEPLEVGRYRILDRLGHGGSGVVYRAHDPALGRDVALKLVRADDSAMTGAVLAEAHALAKISHPNVLPVYDVGTCPGAVYIAAELIEGATLGAWFAEHDRCGRETIRVLLDAGRGLAAAHAAGLVHRDFKPSNVMVGTEGRVRVVDFGLARPALQPVASAGTPGYLAPELLAGAPPSPRSDQYAFCVTFHEALTLRRPEPRWWLGIVKPIIARGLRADPTQRHASMDTLIHRFERRRSLMFGAGLASAALTGAAVTGALLT